MDMTSRKNPFSKNEHFIPRDIAELMENILGCRTDGRDKSGLRWVDRNTNIPCVFFEKITEVSLNIYILPSTKDNSWRNSDVLRDLLIKTKNTDAIENIHQKLRSQYNELRLKSISWDIAKRVLPNIVNWSRNAQKY